MTQDRIEGAKPTRMQLLEIGKKLKIADKGHKILEEKRDALVEKFFKFIEKRDELTDKLDEDFKRAFLALTHSQMILGEQKVEDISFTTQDIGEVEFSEDNVMGVKIPKMDTEKIDTEIKPVYDFFDTTARLDDAQREFNALVSKLIELADLVGGINSLSLEIEKTKRRVNVLENNLIPKLKATQRYIEMQLEERERDDFVRRKRIKALMESNE